MQREEKIKLMKQKIIESATQEFNECGYDNASLNQVCKKGDISKGIIYHYFKDKDELYLACVKECYETLLDIYRRYLETHEEINIQEYMKIRMQFFSEYPMFRGLFFHSLLNSPDHLKTRVNEIRRGLADFNVLVYRDYLTKLDLRVSLQKAIAYLDICQNSYNEYFKKMYSENDDNEEVMKMHEAMIPEWIDFMLYGIAKEK